MGVLLKKLKLVEIYRQAYQNWVIRDSDDSYNSLHVRAQRYVSLLLANESSEPAEIRYSSLQVGLSCGLRTRRITLPVEKNIATFRQRGLRYGLNKI
jgi:hypothetical protein